VAAATSEVLRLAAVEVVAPVWLAEGSVVEATVLLFSLVVEVVGSAGGVVLVEPDVEPVAATEPVAEVVELSGVVVEVELLFGWLDA